MKRDASKVLEEALALPDAARSALVDSLLESLDSAVDEDAEAAWAREIEKRVSEMNSGAVRGVPWTAARTRLMQTLRHGR
jgi:putative addiction module component (TIGR02574 family)